ncbi:MAG: Nif3-like dinuclear metal center hexameric protein [Chlamydiales bacterium]|nr:Nif3-like dinuclear metal center hexameric protein [Chlamydiales bacterium]
MTLQELCQHLKTLLTPDLYNDYCPNGLQVEGEPDVTRIVTAVSASEETIHAAIDADADVLIVHHGMFWQGDSPVISGSKRRKLQMLLQNGVSLLAYHLPLDAHNQVGNNWKAAIDLQWQNLAPFGLYRGQNIGVKGDIAETSPDAFKTVLESYYGHTAYHAPGGPTSIRSVALISGGAYKSVVEAAQQGVDAFITGNFDEPAWYLAQEEGIHFYALGHAATERVGPKALATYLQNQFNVSAEFIDIHNPF